MKELLTVKEVSELAGISVRTLHYYDEVGLLVPVNKTKSNYRLYNDKNIERLCQILFYKELDLSLSQIKMIIDNPNYDVNVALIDHKKLLVCKRDRLNDIIASINSIIMKGFEKAMVKSFNNDEFEQYKTEAIKKYGEIAEESYKKVSNYSQDKWETIKSDFERILDSISKNMDLGYEDTKIQSLIGEFKEHISKNYYKCDINIFKNLGNLYIEDEKFKEGFELRRKGLSFFMKDAIDYYCKNNK